MTRFIAAFAFIGGASALQMRSEPNARLGAQMGDLISSGVSARDPSAFQQSFQHSVMAGMPVVVNDAVAHAVANANAKAASMQAAAAAADTSFLKLRGAETPTVNLHVESGPGAAGIVDAELRAARHELSSLEDEEARFKELYANALLRQNTRGEGIMGASGHRAASFIQQGPVRSAVENAAELASDVQREAVQAGALKRQIGYFGNQIDAGGYTARKAVAALTNLMAEPNGRLAASASMSVLSKLKKLMSKESTPDQLRIAAGSLITQITNLPVSSESTADSGGYGHVNVVMPRPERYDADAEVMQLRSGAAPADTLEGEYYP